MLSAGKRSAESDYFGQFRNNLAQGDSTAQRVVPRGRHCSITVVQVWALLIPKALSARVGNRLGALS